MRKHLFVLCTIAFFGSINHADAQIRTGNELLEKCKSGHAYDRGQCDGFIRGTVVGFDAGNFYASRSRGERMSPPNFCVPTQAILPQIRDVIIRDLEQYPNDRHLSAELLLIRSLVTAYPCGSRQ
jgi:hypothetical protein